ncbi:hypothetical protein DBB_36110 [Desulfoluna spongiiphila]|nr:hypothetical protein DBB_36110 [Desulfoluna spongiiphila]
MNRRRPKDKGYRGIAYAGGINASADRGVHDTHSDCMDRITETHVSVCLFPWFFNGLIGPEA